MDKIFKIALSDFFMTNFRSIIDNKDIVRYNIKKGKYE